MPGRSRAVTVSERPSTSSGPESNKSGEKPSFDKRVSRDDLALILKSSGKGNIRAYHIPIRGRLPSPEASPRSKSPTRVTTVRTSTPESMGDTNETGIIAIGMALGSPSHPPALQPPPEPQPQPQPRSQPHPQPEMQPAKAAAVTEATEKRPEDVPVRSRSRKWSIFGRSKSKRGKTADTQRSIGDNSNASKTSIATTMSPSTISLPQRDDKNEQDSKKTAKHKPIVIGTQAAPLTIDRLEMRELRTPIENKDMSRKLSTRSFRGQSKSRKAERPDPSPIPPVPQLTGPFLDVEIPSIKMERYSVMFGDLLQSQPASSLLARRQATLDRLKTLNDQMAQEGIGKHEELPQPPRMGSSPPKDSPSLSLFPNTPSGPRSSTPQKFNRRSRSNTSPAMLHSPLKDTFDEPIPSTQVKQTRPKPRPRAVSHDRDSRQDLASPSLPRSHPSLVSKFNRHKSHFATDKSSPVVDSPVRPDIHIKEKLRPDVVEPVWEMITPPPSTASSSTASVSKKATQTPIPTSPDQTTATKPSDDDPEEALMTAVKVSIARQISVSHQQRKMLRPLQSHPSLRRPAPRPAGPLASSSLDNVNVGKTERLAEIKTVVPTLVVPDESAGDSPKLAFRKSERVILEDP